MKFVFKKIYFAVLFIFILVCFFTWQFFKKPETNANWMKEFQVLQTAEFNGDIVTVKNVRNFRYSEDENPTQISYYDQDYNLQKISKLWYIVEPFKSREFAAHTFLSFEFFDGKFLTISIEARKKVGQDYSLIKGILKTYPLIYVAADERDAILVRTNIRKDKIFLYPVKASTQEVKDLFVDMLLRMNNLAVNPQWYNTFTANCTSSIAYHINKIWPGRVPKFSWQIWITGYAEKLAFNEGLIDTNLTIEDAREKYYITQKAQEIGDDYNFSQKIREF